MCHSVYSGNVWGLSVFKFLSENFSIDQNCLFCTVVAARKVSGPVMVTPCRWVQ